MYEKNKNSTAVIRDEENQFWSEIFKKEITNRNDNSNEYFSSYWWEEYYKSITNHVLNLLSRYSSPEVLEAGSGSGKASILLGKDVDRTFLDISKEALEYSKHLADKFECNNIKYIEGDIFNLPFKDDKFDFTWNIGVIEHYPENLVEDIMKEMIRVTRSGGLICIAFPNFNSLPIVKARILKFRIFSFIKGYRLGSEKKYNKDMLLKLANNISLKSEKKIIASEVFYVGNPLFMETPKVILRCIGPIINKVFPKNRFLTMVFFDVA